MNFYLATIVISIIFQIAADIKSAIYRSNNPEDINYLDIGKYNVLNKKLMILGLSMEFLLRLILLLIPAVNVVVYGYILHSCGDEKSRRKRANKRRIMLSPQSLINIYENQESIEDSLKIDGLSEEEIREQVKLANQESGHTYISDKVYNDIVASQRAIEYLSSLEQNEYLNLSRKDKIKLLRQYRKAFSFGSKETLKPIEKTLKLANRQ